MTTDFFDEDGLPGPASPAVTHTEATGPTSWRQRLTPAFVNVLILGACFFLLFFSYNTTQVRCCASSARRRSCASNQRAHPSVRWDDRTL